MDAIASPQTVSEDALKAFQNAKQSIIEAVVDRSLEQTDQVVQHGDQAEVLIRSGIHFTMDMLEAAMSVNDVALLEDQLTWAMDRLPHDNVAPSHVLDRFGMCVDAVREHLTSEYAAEIIPFITWMIDRQRELLEGA